MTEAVLTPKEKFESNLSVVDELLEKPEEMKLADLSADCKRQMEATEKHIGDKYHKELRKYRDRCWQAEQLGLERLSLLEIGELLEGKKYTKLKTWSGYDGRPGGASREYGKEHVFEYFYDHRANGEESKSKWAQEPIYLKSGLFSRAPKLVLSRLPNLQEEVPYPALLKVEQFKPLNLFNCFSVVGPEKAFRSMSDPIPEPVDPVLVGCVYNFEFEPTALDDPKYVSYYPLAKW
jgi:hypothetical protein